MGRRSSLLEDLIKLPWPFGAVFAVLCYPIALVFSSFLASGQSQISEPLSKAPLTIWPYFAAIFGFASLMSFIIGLKKKNLYKENQSLEKIRGLTWRQFEHYISEHFKTQDYFVVETPEGPDGGVDLVLRKNGEKTYVQCKHWKSSKVGVEKVRALLGSMAAGGAHTGIFVITGSYTKPAKAFGTQHGLQMIDGAALKNMIDPELNNGPSPGAIQANEESVPCPFCQGPMVKRIAKRGSNQGNSFWGCSRFPACKGIRNV